MRTAPQPLSRRRRRRHHPAWVSVSIPGRWIEVGACACACATVSKQRLASSYTANQGFAQFESVRRRLRPKVSPPEFHLTPGFHGSADPGNMGPRQHSLFLTAVVARESRRAAAFSVLRILLRIPKLVLRVLGELSLGSCPGGMTAPWRGLHVCAWRRILTPSWLPSHVPPPALHARFLVPITSFAHDGEPRLACQCCNCSTDMRGTAVDWHGLMDNWHVAGAGEPRWIGNSSRPGDLGSNLHRGAGRECGTRQGG